MFQREPWHASNQLVVRPVCRLSASTLCPFIQNCQAISGALVYVLICWCPASFGRLNRERYFSRKINEPSRPSLLGPSSKQCEGSTSRPGLSRKSLLRRITGVQFYLWRQFWDLTIKYKFFQTLQKRIAKKAQKTRRSIAEFVVFADYIIMN